MKNRIKSMTTERVETDEGPTHCIFVAVDIEDIEDAPHFTLLVAEKFLSLRMMSPPDTHLLLITIVGPLDATIFRAYWSKISSSRPDLKAFVAMMRQADVVQGNRQGAVLSSCSLLERSH